VKAATDDDEPDGVPGRPDLYGPALAAARRVLRRLDAVDVPAPLRRVAASSDPRLPPPLAAALLRALDRDDWLRAEVLAVWQAGGDPAAEASDLLLRRPPGWEERIRLIAETGERRSGEERTRELERDRERLRARVAELEDEIAACRAQVDDARRETAARAAETVARLRRRLAALRERARVEARERERLATRLEETERRLAEAGRRIDLLREVRDRPAAPRAGGTDVVVGRGRPLAAARTLDAVVAALAPPAVAGEERPRGERFALPPTVLPDDRGALDWLLGEERAVLLLVDGYNVAHGLAPAPDVDTRRRVEAEAMTLHRVAAGPLTVVVFWDSAVEESTRREGGIEVRFVPSADEAIIAAARDCPQPVVVVSSDRRVREECERAGAVGLWAEAWTGRR